MRSVIAMYVENKHGVLARVSGLFMRRGFNIDSLTVGETEDPGFSRITITMNGDEREQQQVINQVMKLQNVKRVKLLGPENSVERELMLLKVKNTPDTRSEIMAAAEIFRAKIVNYTADSLCIEVTGEPTKIKAFIEIMTPLGIIEMDRTGVVALERGADILGK